MILEIEYQVRGFLGIARTHHLEYPMSSKELEANCIDRQNVIIEIRKNHPRGRITIIKMGGQRVYGEF